MHHKYGVSSFDVTHGTYNSAWDVAPPRLHHLRHSFAVNTLLKWYQYGIDAGQKLIHLSTFLGHVDPTSTSVYLQITQELLRAANDRFEQYAIKLLQGERQ